MRILPFGMGRGGNHPSEHGWNMVHVSEGVSKEGGGEQKNINSSHINSSQVSGYKGLISVDVAWKLECIHLGTTSNVLLQSRPTLPTNHDEGHLFQHVFAVGEELPEPYCFPALLHIVCRIFQKEPPWNLKRNLWSRRFLVVNCLRHPAPNLHGFAPEKQYLPTVKKFFSEIHWIFVI